MLNRVLIVDPHQTEALTVLSRHLYAMILREAFPFHKLMVNDPALFLVVNEHFWNIYAQSTRMDLSLGMEMGGFDKPTTADYLYRMLSAMQTLAAVRPDQLDNRFRLGVALRWNNDQGPSIETHQSLVKAIPAEQRAGRAEALLQLAWSRINKVAWNRILTTRIFAPRIKMLTKHSRLPICRSINSWPSTPKPTVCCSPPTEIIGHSWSE